MVVGEGNPPLAGKRVIIVEDDEISLYAIARMLSSFGCEVIPFSDYQGALTEIESDRPVALLITDIKLPAGTPHGISLAQMARERRRDLPLIFVTAYEEYAQMIGFELGGVILKPIDSDILLNAVRTACNAVAI